MKSTLFVAAAALSIRATSDSSSVMFRRVGTSLVTWSTRASGMFRARPTSFRAALAGSAAVKAGAWAAAGNGVAARAGAAAKPANKPKP